MTSIAENQGADLTSTGRMPDADGDARAVDEFPRFDTLPRELGVMLISAGLVGFVMPGPGTPALIAGGMVLWPKGFGKAETWFKRRFPAVHRGGMQHVWRYLDDLERRYPGSLGS